MKKLLAFLAVMLTAGMASAATYNMKTLGGGRGNFYNPTSAVTTNDFLVAPAYSFQRISFTRGSAFTATVYACDTTTYAAGTCTSVATLSATDPDIEVTTGRQWLVIDVTAAETGSNVSYITIQSNPQNAGAGGSGGGVEVVTQARLATDGEQDVIYQVTDATDGTDCATGTAGAATAFCGWNGSAYVAVGVAGGVDNMGNMTATGDLQMGTFDVVSSANNDIDIDPGGTGVIDLVGPVRLNGAVAPNGQAIGVRNYYAGTQTEIQTALTACGDGVGIDGQTGCVINLEGGVIDVDATGIVMSGSTAATGRMGVILRGMGAGAPANATGYPNSGTTLRKAGAATGPIVQVGVCIGCGLEDVAIAGEDTATKGVYLQAGAGAPLQGFTMRRVSIHEVNGPAIEAPCTDNFNTGGPPQTSGSADNLCDSDGTTVSGQFDTSLFDQVQMYDNASCYYQGHTQTLGVIFRNSSCGWTTASSFKVDNGSFQFLDGYIGETTGSKKIFEFDRSVVNWEISNNQIEIPGLTGVEIVDDFTTAGTDTEPGRFIFRNNQVIYDLAGNTLINQRRKGVSIFEGNRLFNQGTEGHTLAANFTRDATYNETLNRLVVVDTGNIPMGASSSDLLRPERFIATYTDQTIERHYNVAVVKDRPAVCVMGEALVDTDDGNLYTCNGSNVWTVKTGGSGDFLRDGSLAMTGNLNLAANDIVSSGNEDIDIDPGGTGVIDLIGPVRMGGTTDFNGNAIISKVEHSPSVNVAAVNAPFNETNEDSTVYFAIEGAKNLCVDIYNTPASGGGAQSADPPGDAADGFCDSDGITKAGKTKVYGEKNQVVNLTQTEAYGKHIEVIAGGDTDTVGLETYVRCTGGAQDEGDEGCQVLRNFATDSYYAVEGEIDGTLAAGSGAATLTIHTGSLTETESQLVGENKWLVFNANASGGAVAQDVNIVTLPAGTVNASGVETTTWATGAKTWEIEDGIVASSGVGGGWCFASKDSAYLDYNGVESHMWLPIASSGAGDGTMDTIVTDIWIQGVNHGLPRGYLAATGTDEGMIAPCVSIDNPTLDSSKVATAIDIIRPTGFDGTSADATFVVSEYPNQLLMGGRFHTQRAHGSGLPHTGVQSVNLLTPGPGRYQGGNAFEAGHSMTSGVPADVLKDGAKHPWISAFKALTGAAQYGFHYVQRRDTAEDYTNIGAFGLVDISQEDYDDEYPWPIIALTGFTDSYDASENLTYNKITKWGMYDDPFLRVSTLSTLTELDTLIGLTGTPDNTKFLRDDGVWANPPGSGLDGNGTATYIPYYLDADTFSSENVFTYNSGTNTMTVGAVSATAVSATTTTGTTSLVAGSPSSDGSVTIYKDNGASDGTAIIVTPINHTSVITTPAATSTLATLALSETLTNKTLTSPVINTPAMGANSIDDMGEIATAIKSGEDATLITGTEGTSGHCAQWNADGDLVTTGAACGGGGGLPVVDTTSIAEGSVDPTKEVRFEVDGITTGTVRVLTMPDADVNLGALTAANLAAGSLTAADAAADLATQAELDAKSAASSTDNAIARFDSTAGDIQNSVVTIADTTGNMAGIGTLDASGAVTAASFTADASPSPTITLTDSDTSGDATIQVQDFAGPETEMAFFVEQGAGSLTEYVTLDGVGETIDLLKPTEVTGLISTTVGLDAIGNVDMDYGSADVTDHTFLTDGTGTGEVVLPAGSIDGTEILDDTITLADIATGTDGELITYDASGNPAHVAVGTDGQFLESNGAGAAPAFRAISAADITTGSLDLGTGTMRGAVSVEQTGSTTHSLTAFESQWLVADETGTTTINLANITAAGENFCVYASTAQTVIVNPDDTDTITYDTTTDTAGHQISGPVTTIGAFGCFLATTTSNWVVLGRSGTWVPGA